VRALAFERGAVGRGLRFSREAAVRSVELSKQAAVAARSRLQQAKGGAGAAEGAAVAQQRGGRVAPLGQQSACCVVS
jgi:hypothetical protein